MAKARYTMENTYESYDSFKKKKKKLESCGIT